MFSFPELGRRGTVNAEWKVSASHLNAYGTDPVPGATVVVQLACVEEMDHVAEAHALFRKRFVPRKTMLVFTFVRKRGEDQHVWFDQVHKPSLPRFSFHPISLFARCVFQRVKMTLSSSSPNASPLVFQVALNKT